MGLFKKLKEMGGTPDKELLQNGRLGRGLILGIDSTNVSTGSEGFEVPVCVFTVEVTLDNTPAYQAQVRQAVPYQVIGQMIPGQTAVAVRVDPEDPSHVALDLATEPPTVTVAREGGGAAEVLARGVPVRAVIVATQPMGMKNPEGLDIHAFILTVLQDGQAPRQTKVGNPVPPEAVPLLFNGANVPAKVLPEEPDGVVIDWQAALAEYSKQPGSA
jgi:hypothetical protein